MPFCHDCDEYYSTAHNCPPVWEVRLLETKYQNEWHETHAHDAEAAAARFCELYDRNGDYDIIQRGSAEVEVRKPGEEAIVIVDIWTESVPRYYGAARKPALNQQQLPEGK